MKKFLKFLVTESSGLVSLSQLITLNKSTSKKFEKNLNWIKKNVHSEGGINVSSRIRRPYPEVTGYLVESLLDWGERDLAISFVKYLISIQDSSGGFYDSSKSCLCVFDTGQIIRGLLRAREMKVEVGIDEAMKKALFWIVDQIGNGGKINIPEEKIWGGGIPRAITLYALEPSLRAARVLGCSEAEKKIELAISYLLKNEDLSFKCLNHFHAYIVEALVDLGQIDLASKELNVILGAINKQGKIPAFPNVNWACSTAQFQYAKIFYKVGDLKNGDLAFNFGLRNQNRNGGWFGTIGLSGQFLSPFSKLNGRFGRYFPLDEISWANKFFMDSLNWRMKTTFDSLSQSFSDFIDLDDGRLQFLISAIRELNPGSVADLGCGKGRYLNHLVKEFSQIEFIAMDISEKNLSFVPIEIERIRGSLTNIPLNDNSVDFAFAVESLEHAIHVSGAIREIHRVLKKSGTLIVIDKNTYSFNRLKLPDWEQWFIPSELKAKLGNLGFETKVVKKIQYENRNDRLFTAWVGTKK